MQRFRLAALMAVAFGGALFAVAAPAQNYPNRFLKFVVTYPAGGSSDAMARIIGQRLGDQWGQQVIVESKPGAAGAIGMEYAAKQPPDGYTFLLGNFGPVVANPLLSKVNYNVQKEFIPVGQITRAANILVVPVSLPVKSTQQLIALAKARPGEMAYATSGPGSMSHLIGEMFKRQVGVDIIAVAYKGGPLSIADLMGGHIPMMFSDAQPVMANIRSGKLRALAVTSAERTPFTPEIPTLAEGGVKGFDASNWWGILFPAGVQRPIVDKVAADLVIVLARPDVKERLGELGIEAVSSTPEQFAAFMASEAAKWGKVIKEANIRVD
jgi:tripartite-type tricarboxylate transporter receptor subunit TctC